MPRYYIEEMKTFRNIKKDIYSMVRWIPYSLMYMQLYALKLTNYLSKILMRLEDEQKTT